MDDLKYIITVITVSFIIYGLVLIFSPAGNMGKYFKSVVGVSLIAVVVLTVSKQGIEFNFGELKSETDIKIDSSVIETVTAEYTNRSVENYIAELLKQNGCKYNKLEVFTYISSDGGISIDRVEISCSSEQSENIKRIVGSLSLRCEITESEDGI